MQYKNPYNILFWFQAADQNVSSTTTDNVPLPPNCEVLTTEWGSKVYLLGTNGFCQKCLQNVTEVTKHMALW